LERGNKIQPLNVLKKRLGWKEEERIKLSASHHFPKKKS
jgi:hypothetical protein